MLGDDSEIQVLWLTPDKPENISIGRERIANELSRRGFKVTVQGTTPRTVWKSLCELGAYDVVIGTTRAGAFAATLIGQLGRLPVVVDHIDPIQQFYDTHPRWLAWIVERIELITFRLAVHVLYVYDLEEERVNKVSDANSKTDLGVDHDRFEDPAESILQAAATRLDGRNLEENVVMYIGGLDPIYNIEVLLDAMDHLSGWSLVIAGAGSLESMVEDRAMAHDDIEYLGAVPHETVPGYLHQADVGISLVDDPHTLKVLEYLASSIPAVQLDGRARERFGDYVTYCSLDPSDVAGAINEACGEPVTKEAQDFVCRMSWANISDQYESVLREAMKDST